MGIVEYFKCFFFKNPFKFLIENSNLFRRKFFLESFGKFFGYVIKNKVFINLFQLVG